MKWEKIIDAEKEKKYYKDLILFIDNEYKNKVIYPKKENIFSALDNTSFDNVKVVIIGQDPYHGTNQAHGLAFSVENAKMPPSLRNIFKELNSDLGIKRENNNLTNWSEQGVLLLNAILTVEDNKPLSHKNKGWEIFTDLIIKETSKKGNIVFILWGNYARSKKNLILENNYIIESVHPSPLSASRGFFGSKPFSKTNNYLKENNIKEIKW